MRVFVMGCGRVGAALATLMDKDGHDVIVLDRDERAFRRLGSEFGGRRYVGNGIDEDVLRRAGIEGTDVFIALTQGDNRNVMSCQIAKHLLGVPRAVCRIYDPVRQEIFAELGLETISPTKVGAELFRNRILQGGA